MRQSHVVASLVVAILFLAPGPGVAQKLTDPVAVEGQPLAANVNRLLQALELVGAPLPKDKTDALQAAIKDQDAKKLQQLLDPHVLVLVSINPESRVKAARGPAVPILQQAG